MDTDQYKVHQGGGIVGLIIALIMGVIYLCLIVLIFAGLWKTFVKMGKPGWAGIIPFYNVYLMVEATGKPVVVRAVLDSLREHCRHHHGHD